MYIGLFMGFHTGVVLTYRADWNYQQGLYDNTTMEVGQFGPADITVWQMRRFFIGQPHLGLCLFFSKLTILPQVHFFTDNFKNNDYISGLVNTAFKLEVNWRLSE